MSEKKEKRKKRRRELPPISDEFFDGFNAIRKRHNATWEEVFERLYNYQDWVEHLFRLNKAPVEADKLNAVTVTLSLPTWLEHIYRNFFKEHVKSIQDIKEIKGSVKPDTPGLAIAHGPSLYEDNNLEHLANSRFYKEKKGVILTVAHSLKDCLDANVIPDYMIMIDADKEMMNFINHDIVDKHAKDIVGIFSPTIDPDVLKQWKGKKYFYLPIIPDTTIPNVQAVLAGLLPFLTELDSGSNCGYTAWNIARYIGCNPIAVLGLDLSFPEDTPLKETPYYRAFRKSYKSDDETFAKCYHYHTHSFFNVTRYTDDTFNSFMETATLMFREYQKRNGIKTINCSPGIIDDPEIENMWFTQFLNFYEEGNKKE